MFKIFEKIIERYKFEPGLRRYRLDARAYARTYAGTSFLTYGYEREELAVAKGFGGYENLLEIERLYLLGFAAATWVLNAVNGDRRRLTYQVLAVDWWMLTAFARTGELPVHVTFDAGLASEIAES